MINWFKKHLSKFFGFTVCYAITLTGFCFQKIPIVIIFTSTAIAGALIKESLDTWFSENKFSWWDLTFEGIGILLAVIIGSASLILM